MAWGEQGKWNRPIIFASSAVMQGVVHSIGRKGRTRANGRG